MIREHQINLLDLIMCLSSATDLINPSLVNHHKLVAYITLEITSELELSEEEQNNIVLAALLHDIGALSLKERMSTLKFEIESQNHAETGSALLKIFEPLSKSAQIIKYHHTSWNEANSSDLSEKIPFGSHILHLADRIAVLINKQEYIINQINDIIKIIEENSEKKFSAQLVKVFKHIANKECFWFNCVSPLLSSIIKDKISDIDKKLTLKEFFDFVIMISHVIDFRSRFTATHSCGIASSAEALAKFCGLSENECYMMKIAGYLHDLGKLAVPKEILEKQDRLTNFEFNIIKCHTYYTYQILKTVPGLEEINEWASFHHERLNGYGYPFHHEGDNLSIGSRIMSVADVFTAITEDRPYRNGMPRDSSLKVLNDMAKKQALDTNIVNVLANNFDEINHIRSTSQASAKNRYDLFSF
ncbi:HD domain-containing protein [Candidatus Desantisbacteria bacterium]|nr:HD domain-containing protein [Candidatus Desantisbacteria bacterium]